MKFLNFEKFILTAFSNDNTNNNANSNINNNINSNLNNVTSKN
jgi:hypothetical protein